MNPPALDPGTLGDLAPAMAIVMDRAMELSLEPIGLALLSLGAFSAAFELLRIFLMRRGLLR